MSSSNGVALGPIGLERDRHVQDVCGGEGHSGFGSLLFERDGRVAIDHDSSTWLYAAELDALGRWVSVVRRFDLARIEVGPRDLALLPSDGDEWAVIHHAMRVGDDLVVAFYSNGRGVRVAYAPKPEGPFSPDPVFRLEPQARWERCHSGASGSSLEANGAFVLVEEDETRLVFWEGYDSYCPAELGGELGWVKLELDKRERCVRALERHPANPLRFMPEGHLCARCGGNLASDVRLGGERMFFYYTRRSRTELSLCAALSRDPLFQEVSCLGELDRPLGDEVVVEKFQAYLHDGKLHLLYESRLETGRWCTGLRRYVVNETDMAAKERARDGECGSGVLHPPPSLGRRRAS